MKRMIAAGLGGLLLFAGAASAATPTQRIAKLEKQVKALQATVKKQQKAINRANDAAAASLAVDFCLLGATTDALQSTWTTIDQAMGSSVFGTQQTIGDAGACSALRITRQGIRTPPTLATFSALVALVSSRTSAFRLYPWLP